jgi:hypothetical protein
MELSPYDIIWQEIAEELDQKLGRVATDAEIQAAFDQVMQGPDDHIDDSLNGN